jgi:N-methylhydantoinase B
VRYWTADGVNPEIEAIIRNNSRAPDVVVGDLRGQVGATRLGARRLDALCGEYGAETVAAAMASLIERTTARVRAEIARWPDGSFEGEGFMDHDGADKTRAVRIHVRATKTGDRLTLDFSGTDPQTRGPINTPQATAQAVSMQAVLAASDPTIPMNAGAFAAVEFAIPPGRLVSPQFPATVNHYFPTSHLVYNCVLAALGQFNPKRAVAPSGMGCGAIAIGYPTSRMGRPTVQYELMNSSLGGTTDHDGAAMLLPMNHFAPGTPVEIVETEYPVAIHRFDFIRDSAGAGRRRGGVGYLREYHFLTDCILTARTSNHRHAAWGSFGGGRPKLAATMIRLPDGAVEEMDILETRQVQKGTTLTLSMSGGGGYGDPVERETELVQRDIDNGYVSREQAESVYGVVLQPGGVVDEAATQARRAAKRG